MMPAKKVFVRAPYNYDTEQASFSSGLICPEPTLTQQSQEEEANINTIVRKFGLTGHLPVVPVPPTFGDFDIGVSDYHSAVELVRSADVSFMALPADVRAKFGHDAGKFVDFCSDPANLEEMRKLGLAVPKAEPAKPAEPSTPSP